MMIGRESQLQQILKQTEQMIGGRTDANVLFVTGEAGIGKSTLLRAVKERCSEPPGAPLIALAECSTPLAGQEVGDVEALEPWAAIMSQLAAADHHASSNTRQIVAKVAMAWMRCIPIVGDVIESVMDTAKIVQGEMRGDERQSPPHAASQQQVFQQYINVLENLSEHAPLVLMLDDFHWADSSSANLLFAAARQLQRKRVLFVVAYRPDDAASSRDGQGHPLIHVRGELERYDLAMEVDVPRMTANDLDLLLRSRYRNYRNNDPFEEWLAATGGGNALFITQFLNTLEEDGIIDPVQGAISDGYQSVDVPRTVGAVIQERIRRLSEDARELLRYASVEGDTFTAAMLSKVTETPQLKLLQKLRLIEQTHQVVRSLGKRKIYTEETSAYQFVHTVMHRQMYESLGEEERELLHEMILAVLKKEWEEVEGSGTNVPGMAARIAVHAGVLGEDRFAAEILLRGAHASWKDYAEEETLHLLDDVFDSIARAVEVGGAEDADFRIIRAKAYMLRRRVHVARGRLDEVLFDSRLALSLLEGTDRKELWVEALNGEAAALQWLGENDAAEERARLAMSEAQQLGYIEGECGAATTIGHVKALHGMWTECLDWRLRAVELAQGIGDGENTTELSSALNNLGIAYRMLGEHDAAAECYRQSLQINLFLGDQLGQSSVLNNLASISIDAGDRESALGYLLHCRKVCHATGDEWTDSYCLHNLGWLEQKEGRVEEALPYYEQALAILWKVGDNVMIARALRNMADVYDQLGDLTRSIALYRQSLSIYELVDNPEEIANTCLWLGAVYRKQGDFPSARINVERALAIARQQQAGDREAGALGCLGLVEEQESQTLDGSGRRRKLDDAASNLAECVRIFRSVSPSEAPEWEEALERIRGMLGSEESQPT